MSNVVKFARRPQRKAVKPYGPSEALKNTCDALEYCRGRLIDLDPADPLIRKVNVTLEAGRAMLAKAEGTTP